MRASRVAPIAAAAVVIAGSAVTLAAHASSAAVSAAALSNNWYASAPYLMPQSNNPPDPATVMAATGQKAFQLAFILAPNGGGCSPTWDGTRSLSSDADAANLISRIRANGGDVSVSIGGFGGTKPGPTSGSAPAHAAADNTAGA